ncbi:hypothetical protein [Streptomyces cyaneofuscatus]|uniref:hypothetical protein n=1 Tax=Streptomyces cyaneofuscatus TaxID=66883 RepID=UPI0036514141
MIWLNHRASKLALLGTLVTIMIVAAGTPSHATSYFNRWASAKKQWVITHMDSYENYGSTSMKITVTKEKSTVITAAVTLSVGATGGMGAFMTKLGAEVGLQLQASGESTKKTTIAVEATVPARKKYVFYSGTRKAWGKQERVGCDSRRCRVTAKKEGKSWTSRTNGVYQCGTTPKSGLSKLAKRDC